MRIFTVEEPIFKTEPIFIFDCTREELEVYLKKRFRVTLDPGNECAGQMFTFTRPPWRVVWVQRGAMSNLPVVVHEIFHLVTRICADKGVPIVAHHPDGMNGDETAAYLLEFFVRNVVKRIR